MFVHHLLIITQILVFLPDKEKKHQNESHAFFTNILEEVFSILRKAVRFCINEVKQTIYFLLQFYF